MGCPAGAGDDHPDATLRGRLGVAEQVIGGAVGRHDAQLRRNVELIEDRDGGLEHRKVRAAPADHPDARRGHEASAQRKHDRAARARSTASCGVDASAVTWPILRRSKTRRLS